MERKSFHPPNQENDNEILDAIKNLKQKANVEAWQKEILERQKNEESKIIQNVDSLLFPTEENKSKTLNSDSEKLQTLEELKSKNEHLVKVLEIRKKDSKNKQKILDWYKNLIDEKKKALIELGSSHISKKQEFEVQIEALGHSTEKETARIEFLIKSMVPLWSDHSSLKKELVNKLQEECETGKEERKLWENKEKLRIETEECNSVIEKLKNEIEETQTRINSANARDLSKFELRKDRRNFLQELKGNIRVFCRVRPVFETHEISDIVIDVINDKSLDIKTPVASALIPSISSNNIPSGSSGIPSKGIRTEKFNLDHIFDSNTTQSEIFAEVSSFIKSALDGYNVCIFAYGQTGSGKTHTMEGDLSKPETFGIIPRAVQLIFDSTKDLGRLGWKFSLEVSFQEIYNEKLIDLLCRDNKILSNTGLHNYQPTQKIVTSPEELFSLVQFAAENRTTAETQFNATSSRSHSIFQIKITGKNEETKQNHDSVLNLIDLAGSESMDTQNKGKEREQETKSINKSLSALKDVITALAEHKEHIPIRNSKLTYLLKDSLGGNCKTLMFVMVSPLFKNAHQTIQSLRFASKVNSCYIGIPKKC